MSTPRRGTRARPRRPSTVSVAAGAVGVVVLLAGGTALLLDGGDDRSRATAPGPSAATQAATVPPAATPSAAPPLSTAVIAAIAADRTPADARVALEEQLTARAEANLALLRSTWVGDASAAARAARAVAASSTGLSTVVAAWGDTSVATRVSTGLDEQSDASRAYAAAVASDDVEAADRARAQMADVSRRLGALLDTVTDGRIAAYVPPQDAAKYRAYVDALHVDDATAARDAAEWLRARLGREGRALAAGLTGDGPP